MTGGHRALMPPRVGREHGHQVALLGSFTVAGLLFAAGAPMPRSFAGVGIAHSWFVVWAAVLGVSGVVALAGSFWKGRVDRGLEFERAGLTGNAGALLLYTVVAFVWAGWAAIVPGAMVAGIVVAHLYRAVRITIDLRRIERPAP